MIKIDHWFHGMYRVSPDLLRFQVEAENRRLALQRITAITVTPEELVQAIDETGVGQMNAKPLVERLLDRAETKALLKTFS